MAGISLGVAISTPALAQRHAAPEELRSKPYYVAHSITIATFLGGTGVLYLSQPFGAAGADPTWFPGDRGLRGQRSARAAEVSDAFITLTVANPLLLQLGQGADTHLLNASFVYTEALTANLFFNFATKLSARRPRPYTHNVAAKDDPDPDDRNVSFYSGHSSTAFTAAVAGSLLFAESAPDRASRHVVWGLELALAGATANLRVRAGKHYYSDVVVGALVGTGIGTLVPVLHGARRAPEATEYVAAGGGLLTGVLVSALLKLKQESAPLKAKASVDWQLSPWASQGSLGLSASGRY